MRPVELKMDETVKALKNASFPDYRGRKFKAEIINPDNPFEFDNNYWDGGSRSYWAIVELATFRAGNLPTAHPGFEQAKAAHYKAVIPRPGYVIVEHVIFCGKDVGLRFYVHPDNATKLLPA